MHLNACALCFRLNRAPLNGPENEHQVAFGGDPRVDGIGKDQIVFGARREIRWGNCWGRFHAGKLVFFWGSSLQFIKSNNKLFFYFNKLFRALSWLFSQPHSQLCSFVFSILTCGFKFLTGNF